ncbi:MAG: putative 2-aminoethylphosphonate ABC transporter permease subunit [Oscillospiraceae bacterium]|nr:putative 2-aminoethylphosphonate ABC transporter permease subunit [Oscillospiraceae bacterium]MCL2279775.1 putative 2-aminoethylphosphonate ABC transporter permease subunit [Oscillospiraceae bacterium]
MMVLVKNRLARFSMGQLTILILMLSIFVVIMVLPILSLFTRAFQDNAGEFVGFSNFRAYFENPSLLRSLWNTIDVSLTTTVFSVVFGFLFAYGVTRTNIRFKRFFRYMVLIPIFIPTIAHAVGLISLFGRQGIITGLGFEIELFGRLGIILSHVIFTLPQAFLMFYVSLEYADGRLHEAAESMGVKPLMQVIKITLPEVKYTFINTMFVCFTLAFTDFGAPVVIGGGYSVLATDLFVQITGLFNFNMGAVVGTLLLAPAVLAFVINRITNTANMGAMSAKSTKLVIKKNTLRDVLFFIFCSIIILCFLTLVAGLAIRAFTTFFPFDTSLTMANFQFSTTTGGIGSFFNSMQMSLLTAVIGTAFVFIYAYMAEKIESFGFLRKIAKLFSLIPMALPGMVIGVGYILFFNNPGNPFNFAFGTIGILVVANILSFFSVPFLTATGALKKLDKEFESVSDSMNVPRWKLFLRVTVPLSFPAVLETFMYYFVSSMVTISALVFLYTPAFRVASIAISHMHAEGVFAQAAAMSLLILLINVAVRLIYELTNIFYKQREKRRQA